MARYVTCKICGKQFRKASYNFKDGSRYVCRKCAYEHNLKAKRVNRLIKKRNNEAEKLEKMIRKEAQRRERGMKQSYPAMLCKIILGILLLMSNSSAGIAIGAGLILWAVIPFVFRKKH